MKILRLVDGKIYDVVETRPAVVFGVYTGAQDVLVAETLDGDDVLGPGDVAGTSTWLDGFGIVKGTG
jgi:hypothetical protein